MKNNTKKTIIIGIVLLILIATLISCKDNNNITLESMKNALKDAGYEMVEGWAQIDDPEHLLSNAVDGISFFSETDTALRHIAEFKDKASADAYEKDINTREYFYAIANDKFVMVLAKKDGIIDSNEKNFFEKVLNGKPLT